MTIRATLIIHDGTTSQDITAEFDIERPDQAATIRLGPDDVKIDTQHEPKVSTGALTTTSAPASGSVRDVLDSIEPRDSDTALALWGWLVKTQRIAKIGSLDGVGPMFIYVEPKGSTKEGYIPGASVADQIVDRMEESMADKVPAKHGICSRCFSAVSQGPDDPQPRKDDVEDDSAYICSGSDTPHVMA